MNREEILQLLDDERPRFAGYARLAERLIDVTRLRGADGSHAVVVVAAGFHAENADAAIARELDYHRSHGYTPFEWTVYGHHDPGDMVQRLERHGFTTGPREAVMVCDLASARRGSSATRRHPRAHRRPSGAGDEQTLADFRRVAETVFAKDYTFTTNELRDALRAGSAEHRGYVAYAGPDGPPAAVGRLHTHPRSQFGGLYGGGTLAEFRGRGFYRATVAARARDAIASGGAVPSGRRIADKPADSRAARLCSPDRHLAMPVVALTIKQGDAWKRRVRGWDVRTRDSGPRSHACRSHIANNGLVRRGVAGSTIGFAG